MANFIYKPISNSRQIGQKRPTSAIKFIVIHDTGNPGKGANALAHFNYLQRATRYGSAHYFVDDKQIIQVIGDSRVAWSVGDNQGKGRYLNGCNNSNSISIEMCINSDSNLTQAYKNVLELTKNLMKKFNIPVSKVCRHYDVSRKICPGTFAKSNWQKWWTFKEQIKQPIEYQMDLSKSSRFGPTIGKPNPPTKVEDVEGLKEQDKKRKDYLKMREIDPDKLPEWAEKDWEEAKELGITDGTRPGDIATRAEVVAMILRSKYNCKEENVK